MFNSTVRGDRFFKKVQFSDLGQIALNLDRKEIELNNMKSPSRMKEADGSRDTKFNERVLQTTTDVYLSGLSDIID